QPAIPANMSSTNEATVIHMDDTTGKAPATAAPPPAAAPAPVQQQRKSGGGVPFILRSGAEGFRRCMAFVDLLLRVAAFGPTLAAAISTGTSDETLSVFTEFFQFRARFDDFPAFTFFMVANAVAAGYLVLSLPFSIVGIIRPKATGIRLLLLVCDTVMVVLVTAAASAAAAIVYVAHEGSRRANWAPICMQFHGFCQRTSGAVVASFLAVLVFIVLVLLSVFVNQLFVDHCGM
uniref:CASP-like protein n=1 Tax=Aegilops tauschii subsp. strangulata TaxID=200361 RepID=A0A453S4U8_AEGTS